MKTTETVLHEINVVRLTQPALAQVLAMVILKDKDSIDWKQINDSIKARWSKSARERVLTMAWKIAEQAWKETTK